MNKPGEKTAPPAKKPKEEPKEPAEDSVPLRIVVFLMAIVCVGASCILSHSNFLLTGLYLILIASGSFLSYQHRHDELKWLHWLALAGILFVGAGVLKEFMNPLRDDFDFVSPFIHFLAGVFAFVTFEMRSRSDLNLSSTMGLLLLLLIAPVEKGLPLLAVILVYIILGSFMLYFDCLSETAERRQGKPLAKAPEINPQGVSFKRRTAGFTIPALMLIPALSVLVFMFSPRSDDLLDRIMAAGKSFDPGILMNNITPAAPPGKRKLTPEEEQRMRSWFNKRGHNLSNVDPKDANFKKRNANEDVDYIPPRPNQSGTQAKPQSEQNKKQKKNKEADGEANASADKTKNKSKDKSQKNKNKNSPGSPESDNKASASPGEAKDSANSDKNSSSSGGANKNKNGKHSKQGSGGGSGKSSEFVLTDENSLSMHDKNQESNQIILTAKTRRIVYFRRRSFDVYNGHEWTQSDESKIEPVKVSNGEIKREFKVNYAPTQSAVPQYTPPPQNLLAGSQSIKGDMKSVSLNAGSRSSSNSKNSNNSSGSSEASSNAGEPGPDSGHMRPFKFQDQDKPLFRVNMADALKVPEKFPSIELLQEMKVKAKSIGKYVPGAWIPQEVRLFNTTVTVDSMGCISAAKDIPKGTEFKVKTQLPMYDLVKLRVTDPLSYQDEEIMREEFSRYLDLPKNLSQSIFELAEHTTNPQYNWYVQCEQISEFLRKNYKYDNFRETDESSDDQVYDFLFNRKVGHCTDFASAFVIMARCVGIPSRIVTGFSPGTLNSVTGEREIRGKDMYTWAEAYVPDAGWVPFDPSPEGFLPDVKKNKETTIDQVKEQLGLDKEVDEEQAQALIAKVVDVAFYGLGGLIALVVLGLCLRFLIPILLSRLKKSPYQRGPEWAILLKVQKALEQKLKQPRLPTETPLDFIERLKNSIVKTKNTKNPIPRDLPELLNRFYKAYSECYFGQRKEKLEDVREYGKQVIGVASGKPSKVKNQDKENAPSPSKRGQKRKSDEED